MKIPTVPLSVRTASETMLWLNSSSNDKPAAPLSWRCSPRNTLSSVR